MDDLPPVLTAAHLAEFMHVSEGSLAQDRYLGKGIPFVKLDKKVRYLRDDVLEHLLKNRMVRTDGAVPVEAKNAGNRPAPTSPSMRTSGPQRRNPAHQKVKQSTQR